MHKISHPLLRFIQAFALVLISGCAGLTGYDISRTDIAGDNKIFKTALARCPAGKMPISGGYRISDGGSGGGNYMIMVNAPELANGNGTLANWVVHVRALEQGKNWGLTAYATCVDVKR